jgi:VanZ family protein
VGVISIFSTEAFAASETSRYIGPFLRWLLPAASGVTLDALHTAMRKAMHVSEFAVLAVLWYRSLTWERPGWRLGAGLVALTLTVLCAILDETHQAFVPTRTASALDVGWDGLGAFCGLVGRGAAWGWGRGARREGAPTEVSPPGRLRTRPDD